MRYKLSVMVIIVAGIAAGLVFYLHYRVTTPNLPQPPLKTLAAKHGIQLGDFAIATRINEKPYRDILTSQFNLALIDNTPNWYFTDGGLRPSLHGYNFAQMDQLVNFAQQNHLAIQAHHFVWGEEKWLPDWLKNGHFSKSQLLAIMRDHILTVGGRYRGKIQAWSVVNEAFSRGTHIYGLHDWWADQLGGDSYISGAFRWARQADPKAKLILNDFGDETENPISNNMYAYVKKALAQHVPIDAIGLQMHIDGTHPPDKVAVIKNMKRFGALGLQVYVTEFDVNMDNVPGNTAVKEQKEANIYYDMVRACIESKVCQSFSILGITDKETWYSYFGTKNSLPLPFDKKYHPKPAFYSLRLALSEP